jgi:hypothetical protein
LLAGCLTSRVFLAKPVEWAGHFRSMEDIVEAVALEGFDELADSLRAARRDSWAALHGLVMLDRTGRLRPGHEVERIELLVAQFG